MKIIEVSKDWKEPTFEDVSVTCTSCGSKLSIEAEDIKVGYNNKLYFVCPVCFNDSRLDKDIEDKYWNYKIYVSHKRKNDEKCGRECCRGK